MNRTLHTRLDALEVAAQVVQGAAQWVNVGAWLDIAEEAFMQALGTDTTTTAIVAAEAVYCTALYATAPAWGIA